MPVAARRHIRRMRGGAQSHLIEASDGNHYVVKFQNNPQHRRILVNELVCAVLLDYLKIAAAPAEIVSFSREFLERFPEAAITIGTQTLPPDPGWHFGSRYPGDPARLAVYDFIPDSLLERVANLDHFLGILVFDKWVSNADARQCVFFRARLEPWTGAGGSPDAVGFVACMIDHGFAFQGPNWDFVDAPLQGVYPRRAVYAGARSLDSFERWLHLVRHLPEDVLDDALKRVPPEWVNGDEDELDRVVAKLVSRRKQLEELIRDVVRARSSPFVNWERE